ncbi:Putative addiction module component [Belliella baltica DSM 15883]|uniref:Putative addiction module component n=1 Tax=Belliella baltica (strain DSM 15883 / CIP 108006 / LMG 21964 / BA134) TaxID=866536 RepID=I3Z4R5_BELBD|nr:addiction module protein [Belliella baltica]AFL84233.1 Putative addiction module component [Belliella baltica DSM 15883]
MDIQTIKLDLILWLSQLQDASVLQKLQSVKEEHGFTLSEAQKNLLDERLESYKNNPDDLLDWEDLLKELEDRL